MSRQYCEFCHQPIESIDFHLSIKGGCICASCVPLLRSVAWDGSQNYDELGSSGFAEGLPVQFGLPALPGRDEAVQPPVRVLSRHASRSMPRPVLRPMYS